MSEFLKKNKKVIMRNKINSYLLNSYNFLFQYVLQIFPVIFFYYIPYGFSNLNVFSLYDLMKYYPTQFNINRKLHIMINLFSYINLYSKIEFENDEKDENNINNENIEEYSNNKIPDNNSNKNINIETHNNDKIKYD